MLRLLTPLALLGLGTLAIPALLHLWRPPAKAVRIGTLRFFNGPTIRRLNKLRWRERLLLLVRLLLLALLIFLLARPVWRESAPTTPQRWALLEPNVVPAGDALKRWRECMAAGFETRWLDSEFAKVTVLPQKPRTDAQPIDVWSLLREVDARLPTGSKIAVFASNQLRSLHGERPITQHCEIEWVSVPLPNESADRSWIESVSLQPASGDTSSQLDIVIGSTNATQTNRIRTSVPARTGRTSLTESLPDWLIEVREENAEGFAARLVARGHPKSSEAWTRSFAPSPLRVALLQAADRTEDAHYLDAAIRAVGKNLGRPTEINTDAQNAEWIFWLNDQPPPLGLFQQVRERGTNLFSDAGLAAPPAVTLSWFGESRVPLLRRTAASNEGAAVWADGWGDPLLTVSREGRGRVWKFASRFHPDWNDLPRSSALPAVLQSLIAQPEEAAHDLRQADPSQSRPAVSTSNESKPEVQLTVTPENVDLREVLWWACVALFALERLLSLRSSPTNRPTLAKSETNVEPALAGIS